MITSHRPRTRQMAPSTASHDHKFVVPEKFNRNAQNVRDLGPPADTGLWLIQYMCERLQVASLEGLDVLDFGCGSRFADAIVNRNVSLRSYLGIDVDREMIEFLSAEVPDARLSFHHLDAYHPIYNRTGTPLVGGSLPLQDRYFDVICMFSVITHQKPEDAKSIFSILRRHIRPAGRLFFSAYLEEGDFGYREHFPDQPTGLSVYTRSLLESLLTESGWQMLSHEPPNPRNLPILDSILCGPSPAEIE